MDLGIFYIDTTVIADFFAQPSAVVVIKLLAMFGWLFFVYFLLFVALHFYVDVQQGKHTAKWKWVLLAVDVPQLNVQTPKAVEQLFAHLAGAYGGPGLKDKYHGFKQEFFSFEIISIEGYIQFLIRTEEKYRDLVETAVYAQYPGAEITEVEDYVEPIAVEYAKGQYDLWGADFVTEENDALPIRSYRDFEHSISKDTVLKDPMGTLLESFSRLGPGEQMWFQIIVESVGNKWKEKAMDKIREIIGEKKKAKTTWIDSAINAPLKLLEGVGDQVFGREASSGSGEKEGPPNQLQYLTPGQTKLVEAMEEKISKIGFKTKMRGVYVARKEVFKTSRGVNALIGAINQFNVQTANSIVPKKTTDDSAESKKTFLTAYKKRKMGIGANPFILNIEELATVWHFPMSHVQTPLLQKASFKTAEPPSGLPVERIVSPFAEPEETNEPEKKKKGGYKTDSGDMGYDEDDVHFG